MTSSVDNDSFVSLAEQFLAEQDRGDCVSIEQFADRYPLHREELLRYLPKLVMLDEHFQYYPASLPEFPTKLGNYELKSMIGRGGMGIVVSATHATLGKSLAIKLLPVGRFRNQRNLERFNIEARACAMMDHPNIVPVFDFGLTEQFAYFVMRRIDGPTLAEVIKNQSLASSDDAVGQLTSQQIARIIMKACHFEPDERYQTAEELAFVLERCCAGEGRAERRQRPNSFRSRWYRRDRVAWCLSVVDTRNGSADRTTRSTARVGQTYDVSNWMPDTFFTEEQAIAAMDEDFTLETPGEEIVGTGNFDTLATGEIVVRIGAGETTSDLFFIRSLNERFRNYNRVPVLSEGNEDFKIEIIRVSGGNQVDRLIGKDRVETIDTTVGT